MLALPIHPLPSPSNLLLLSTGLRNLSNLSGSCRDAVARSPALTFAATVGHICRAIRKLAAVAEVDESRPLYRGVRGVLPKGFFLPDAAGCEPQLVSIPRAPLDDTSTCLLLAPHARTPL